MHTSVQSLMIIWHATKEFFPRLKIWFHKWRLIMVLLDTISSHYVCPLAFDDLLLVKTEKVSSFFFFFIDWKGFIKIIYLMQIKTCSIHGHYYYYFIWNGYYTNMSLCMSFFPFFFKEKNVEREKVVSLTMLCAHPHVS